MSSSNVPTIIGQVDEPETDNGGICVACAMCAYLKLCEFTTFFATSSVLVCGPELSLSSEHMLTESEHALRDFFPTIRLLI
jgi:hypothetical protein